MRCISHLKYFGYKVPKGVGDMKYDDVLFVAQNMRDRDKRELFLSSGIDSPAEYAKHFINCDFGFVAYHRNIPTTVCSFHKRFEGVYEVGLFGTKDFDKSYIKTTRTIREIRDHAVKYGGIRRLE